MATTLPVTFIASPLPTTFAGNLQNLLDAFAARLSIQSQDDLSFFVTGSVAPTSNVGPWLKNGITWYVWDVTTGVYIPEIIEDQSLRYVRSTTQPDEAKFTFWIQDDATTGQSIAIKTFFSGAWTDVYATTFSGIQSQFTTLTTNLATNYSTTVQMNAAIVAAEKRYSVGAKLSGDQTIATDGSYHKVLFNSAFLDTYAIYDPTNSAYIAPVSGIYRITSNIQTDNSGSVAADMEMLIRAAINGNTTDTQVPYSGNSTPSPNGARWYMQVNGLVNLAQGSSVSIYLTASDGVLAGNFIVSSGNSQFFIELVQAT